MWLEIVYSVLPVNTRHYFSYIHIFETVKTYKRCILDIHNIYKTSFRHPYKDVIKTCLWIRCLISIQSSKYKKKKNSRFFLSLFSSSTSARTNIVDIWYPSKIRKKHFSYQTSYSYHPLQTFTVENNLH